MKITMPDSPYLQSPGPSTLIESFVGYADILGYKQRSAEAIRSGEGAIFLNQLRQALSTAYKRVRDASILWGDQRFFPIKIFTDNIVIGYPVTTSHRAGYAELSKMLMVLSEFQMNLALAGFLIRGGISNGLHYMDDDIVFGIAFLEAVGLDNRGGPPRIALSSSAVEAVRNQMSFHAGTEEAPHYDLLFEDADGTIFLNYLDEAFIAYPDGGVFLQLIEGHMRSVIGGLTTYRHRPDVRAKYEWAARYHNFFCHEYAESHRVPNHPDADPVLALATEQAQRLRDYLIDIEGFTTGPRRISLQPNRDYLE